LHYNDNIYRIWVEKMKITKEVFENGTLKERRTQELTMTEFLLMNEVHKESDMQMAEAVPTQDDFIIERSFRNLSEDYKKREFDC